MTKKVFRRFIEQPFHIEWRIEDGDDDAVARYLCDVFTKKADPFFFTENVRIHIQSVDYCDPAKHGTLQYAIVFSGKLYPLNRIGGALVSGVEPYPIKDVSELVYITVNKGGTNKSLVNFDTAYQEVFIPFSNKVLKNLQKVFTVTPIQHGTKNSYTAQGGTAMPEIQEPQIVNPEISDRQKQALGLKQYRHDDISELRSKIQRQALRRMAIIGHGGMSEEESNMLAMLNLLEKTSKKDTQAKQHDTAVIQEPPKPPEPKERGGKIDLWLNWYHAMTDNGYKCTLEDVAKKSGYSLGYIKQKHMIYQAKPNQNT